MQTCSGQSSAIASGMGTKRRAHCGGRKHRGGTGRAARRKGRQRCLRQGKEQNTGGTSPQIHLGGCGRTAQSQHCRRAEEEVLVSMKDSVVPYKVFSSFRHFSYTVRRSKKQKAELFFFTGFLPLFE